MNPALREVILESGAAPAFSPTDIADLALWIDASDASTITLDGSNNVEQWDDKSGNGRNLVQATVSLRPGYLASGINGLPAVVGDGIDDVMTWTQFSSGTNHNFYLAVAFDTVINQYTQYAGFFGTVPGQLGWNTFHQDLSANPAVAARILSGADVTVLAAGTANNIKSGDPFIFSFLRNAGTYRVKQTHGAIQTLSLGGGFITGTTQSDRIFRNYFGSISFRIAEMVCYSRDLTAGEEASLSAYFLSRYGVGI